MVDQDVDMVVLTWRARGWSRWLWRWSWPWRRRWQCDSLGISGGENVMRGQETAKILWFPLPLTNHPRNLKS
eukprot:scaffold13749_cov190-Skeletonema_marinoi.AAC.4